MQSESELIRQARGGSAAAMEALYEAHKSMVYAVALGVCGNGPDADEVVQETFLRAFRALGDWRGEGKLSSWLYMITTRTAINWRRRFLPRLAPRVADEAPEPEVDAETAAELKRAIAGLPARQRIVLTLRHMRGLSLAEIAELQGCVVGTVKSNLHHAVAKLRDVLGARRVEP